MGDKITNPSAGKPGRGAARPDEKRRRFLLSLGAGSASAAAAGIAGAAGTVAPAQTEPPSKPAGYRETRHVRDYYRSAKF